MKTLWKLALVVITTFSFSFNNPKKLKVASTSHYQANKVKAIDLSTNIGPLKIVSFNVHGPKGKESTFRKIRKDYLKGDEQILCFQEVDFVPALKTVFKDYPYKYITKNTTTKWFVWKSTNVAILSKLPIIQQSSQIIQTDPGGDKWNRNAQYVRIKINSSTNIRLFHYHNTYNWHKNGSASEKVGMKKFKTFVKNKNNGSLSNSREKVFLVGDFNLYDSDTKNILGTNLYYQYNNFVDYVVSTSLPQTSGGIYYISPTVSDHNAVWASYNLSVNIKGAESKVVRLYEHSTFSGQVMCFEIGSYPNIGNTAGFFWNDITSAVVVPHGLQLAAYEHSHYRGKVFYWPQINHSGTLHGLEMNDVITSLKVTTK
ncbi:MAG TPA: hypothetical protein DCS93_37890 [Microscillaceae bacterium]|nr:hypothetical protein [Microscillaceae bacterium]